MFSIEIKSLTRKELPANFQDLATYRKWVNAFMSQLGKVKIIYQEEGRYAEVTGYADFSYSESDEMAMDQCSCAIMKIYKDPERKILAKIIYNKSGRSSPFPLEVKAVKRKSLAEEKSEFKRTCEGLKLKSKETTPQDMLTLFRYTASTVT